MRRLTRLKNDELENRSVSSARVIPKIKTHFKQLRQWQIRISDKEAWNFGIIELMVMMVIGISLMVSARLFGTSIMAGSIIGFYNYIKIRIRFGYDSPIPFKGWPAWTILPAASNCRTTISAMLLQPPVREAKWTMNRDNACSAVLWVLFFSLPEQPIGHPEKDIHSRNNTDMLPLLLFFLSWVRWRETKTFL